MIQRVSVWMIFAEITRGVWPATVPLVSKCERILGHLNHLNRVSPGQASVGRH